MKLYEVLLLFLLYWYSASSYDNTCLFDDTIDYLRLYEKIPVGMLWSSNCPFLTKSGEQNQGGGLEIFLICIISFNHCQTIETRAIDLILQLKNRAFKNSSDFFQILTATGLAPRSSNSGASCSFHKS